MVFFLGGVGGGGSGPVTPLDPPMYDEHVILSNFRVCSSVDFYALAMALPSSHLWRLNHQ